MKNFVLTLLDRETAYGSRLAGYIGGHPGSPFQVKLFLEHPAADEDVGACDIALLTSSLQDIYGGIFGEKPVLVLDEDGSLGDSVRFQAYKYQSAESIYRKLLDICIENGNKQIRSREIRDKDFRLAVLYLPQPSQENSHLMRTWIGRSSGRRKLLYINLEQVPSPAVVFSDNEDTVHKSFSDIVYYLKQDSGNLGARVAAMAAGSSFDSIPPPELASDVSHLTKEDWAKLTQVLREETEYEQLFLDYGCGVPPASVLGCCDELFIFSAGSKWEEDLSSRYRTILERMGRSGLDEILHIIKI